MIVFLYNNSDIMDLIDSTWELIKITKDSVILKINGGKNEYHIAHDKKIILVHDLIYDITCKKLHGSISDNTDFTEIKYELKQSLNIDFDFHKTTGEFGI